MADVVIRAQSVQTTPAGYTVPGAQEIVVRSVRAVVNGASAASAFTPTLQLISPDGAVVWQSPADNTVAAGGSADVSWFPRVGAASSTSTGAALAYCWSDTTFNITNASTTFIALNAAKTFTSDSTIFTTVAGGGGQTTLQILKQGEYRVYVLLSYPVPAAPTAGSVGYATVTGSVYPIGGSRNVPFAVPATYPESFIHAGVIVLVSLSPSFSPPPFTVNIQGWQNSGGTLNGCEVQVWAEQSNPTGNTNF